MKLKRALAAWKTVMATAVLLFYVGCDDNGNELTKNPPKDPDTEQPTETDPGTISATTKDVKEQQVVELTVSNYSIVQDRYVGKIGDIEVELFHNGGQQLVFVVPAQIGTGSFEFTIPIASNKLTFNVTEVILDGTPDAVVEAFVGPDPDLQFEGYIATAHELAMDGLISPAEVDLLHSYRSMLTAALEQYHTLPADEKVAVAKFITANSSGIAELNSILLQLNNATQAVANGRTASSCEDLTYRINKVKCASSLLLDAFIVLGSGFSAAALATNPIGASLATGIVAFVTIPAVISFKQNAMAILDARVKADLVDAGVFSGRQKDDVLKANQPYFVDLRILKTNFQKKDMSSSVSWVRETVSTVEEFSRKWDELRPKIKDAQLSPFTYPDSAAVRERSEAFEFLSVEVLDNSDIHATLSGDVDLTYVTFSGTGTGTFQYRFVYDDGSFRAESEPITATLEAKDESFIELTFDGVTYTATGTNNGGTAPGTYFISNNGSGNGSGPCGDFTSYSTYIGGRACDANGNCLHFWLDIHHVSRGECGNIPVSVKTYSYQNSDSCVPCNPVMSWMEISRDGAFEYARPEGATWFTVTDISNGYLSGTFAFNGCQWGDIDYAVDPDGNRLYCEEGTPYCCKTEKTFSGTIKVKLP